VKGDCNAVESEPKRKYEFSWELLGDIPLGRPNLGPQSRLEVYRLMQYCLRDVMEQHLGAETADRVFYEAGKLAGAEFYGHIIQHTSDFNQVVSQLHGALKDMGIGILRVEKADLERGSFVLTVSEDLDCSGLSDTGDTVCLYDEGFIAALMESATGRRFKVKEVDCWCSGDRTCRFTAEVVS
jgi:uncharacterized protein